MEVKEKKNRRSCKDEALFWLEYGDRTEKEMVQRLRKKGYDEREIAQTMAFLTEYSFLDDARYARKFVEMSKEKGHGPIRIRRELQEKGVTSSAADLAMEEGYHRETERQIAMGIAEKALRSLCGGMDEEESGAYRLSEKDKMKIARRLAAAGFSAQTAYDVIRRL